MAMHSSILAWKIPWTEEPGRLQYMGRKESDTTKQLHFTYLCDFIGKGYLPESSRVRKPKRTTIPHGPQSQVLG